MKQKFNLDLLWKKIFFYTNYRNLPINHKILIDKLFADMSDIIINVNSQKYNNFITDVYDLKTYDFDNLKNKHRFWIIDNPLNIIFTGLYGSHEAIRPALTILHLLVDNKISDEKIDFISKDTNYSILISNQNVLSDIYIAMNYGIYESGSGLDSGCLLDSIISSDHYPFTKLNQTIIKEKYKVHEITYNKEDAFADFLNIDFKD